MDYNYKYNGFSSIEIIIYITLTSIFSTVLFSVIKTNEITNRYLIRQSKIDKTGRQIIEIIENSIKYSGSTGQMYNEKKYINHSFFIGDFHDFIQFNRCEELFHSKSTKGNVLLLEIPKIQGKSAVQKFVVFQFHLGFLLIYEGKISGRELYINHSHTLLEGVTGGFTETQKGILINFSIPKLDNEKQMELRGYENFQN